MCDFCHAKCALKISGGAGNPCHGEKWRVHGEADDRKALEELDAVLKTMTMSAAPKQDAQ